VQNGFSSRSNTFFWKSNLGSKIRAIQNFSRTLPSVRDIELAHSKHCDWW